MKHTEQCLKDFAKPMTMNTQESPAEAGVDVQRLVRKIEVLMREVLDLSREFEAIYDQHPSKYLMNRAWVAMSDARDKAGTGTM